MCGWSDCRPVRIAWCHRPAPAGGDLKRRFTARGGPAAQGSEPPCVGACNITEPLIIVRSERAAPAVIGDCVPFLSRLFVLFAICLGLMAGALGGEAPCCADEHSEGASDDDCGDGCAARCCVTSVAAVAAAPVDLLDHPAEIAETVSTGTTLRRSSTLPPAPGARAPPQRDPEGPLQVPKPT